jgi:hypothetical protein
VLGVAWGLHGCLACNDIGCGGGFSWTARAADGAALAPGAYTLTILLEESRYALTCTVTDMVGGSDCTMPEAVEGDGTFTVDVSLAHANDHDWTPELPAGGFYLRAADYSDSSDDGSYTGVRGPTRVEIDITRDDQPFLSETYDVEYQRDDDFRGDERCGYCDSEEQREASW